MPEKQYIRGWDEDLRPVFFSVADIVDKLESLQCDFQTGRCVIEVPSSALHIRDVVARVVFLSVTGDTIQIDLPMLDSLRARTSLKEQVVLSLKSFDQAVIESVGSVRLRNGTHLHAVSFNFLRMELWEELDEAIIWLTIRAFNAEHLCLRRHFDFVGIDYSVLGMLREPNVKGLARYINTNIGGLKRAPGMPPFGTVSLSRIQCTLDHAGIIKIRGRRRVNQQGRPGTQ